MSSSWRRFSLQQFSPLQFSRKKSEPHPPSTLLPQFKSQRSLSPFSQRKAKKKDKTGVPTIESSSSSDGGIAEVNHSSNMIGTTPSASSWHHDAIHQGVSGVDGIDEMDGSQPQESRSTDTEEQFIEVDEQKAHLISKIERIKEKLKAAHKTQQADVDEFLKVTADIPNTADNPQLMRIRQVFEKKNRKSTQLIQTLQKKMENYQHRLKNLEAGIVRRPKGDNVLINVGQGLKDVGANIKESISGYTGGMIGNIKEGFINASQNAAETMISVPKDLAHKLLKKSGSADNIAAVTKADISLSPNNLQTINVAGVGSRSVHGGGGKSIFYTSLAEDNRQQSMPAAVSSLANDTQQQQPVQRGLVENSASGICFTADDQQQVLFNSNMERFFGELSKIREDIQKTQTMIEEMRAQTQQESTYFSSTLHEEKYRAQRLEDQINDQAELHQAEVTNLRQEIQNLEGRLTYQVNSRMQDMHDDYGKLANEVSALKSRIKEIQQFIGMEGFEGMSLKAKCRRGVMLLAQFFADLLLWTVSLLNAQHVKVMLTVLIFALLIYHVGGFLVWNVLYSLVRYFAKRNSTSVEDSLLNASTVPNVGDGGTT